MFLAATALDVQLEFQIKPSSMQCHPRRHIPGFLLLLILLRAAHQCDDRFSSAVGHVLLEPSPSCVYGDMPNQLRSVRLAHFHCNRFRFETSFELPYDSPPRELINLIP